MNTITYFGPDRWVTPRTSGGVSLDTWEWLELSSHPGQRAALWRLPELEGLMKPLTPIDGREEHAYTDNWTGASAARQVQVYELDLVRDARLIAGVEVILKAQAAEAAVRKAYLNLPGWVLEDVAYWAAFRGTGFYPDLGGRLLGGRFGEDASAGHTPRQMALANVERWYREFSNYPGGQFPGLYEAVDRFFPERK